MNRYLIQEATVYYNGTEKKSTSTSTVYIGGDCGDNTSWRYLDGTLYIYGEGAIQDFEISYAPYKKTAQAPWNTYADRITKIVMDEEITVIGSHAFDKLTNIKEVRLPDDLEEVKPYAFGNGTHGFFLYYHENSETWEEASEAQDNFYNIEFNGYENLVLDGLVVNPDEDDLQQQKYRYTLEEAGFQWGNVYRWFLWLIGG